TRRSPAADTSSRRTGARSWRAWWWTSWRAARRDDHGRLPHLRLGAVAVLGEGALLLPLQAHPARLGAAEHAQPGGVRAAREAPTDPPGARARRQRAPGLDADHRAHGDAASRAVDPSLRARDGLHLGADRGVRRRVGQQADVPLPLVLRAGPGVRRRAHRAL